MLLHTLLGDHHPLVQGYYQFICRWDGHLFELEAEGFDPLAPAKLVRWVQIRITLWFQRQYRTSESLPPPSFLDLFDLIQEMREWKPPIPHRYLAFPSVSSATASSGTIATKGKASAGIQSSVAAPSGAATSGTNAS